MAIFNFTNPGQYGSAYFTLETVPNNQGFFDSSSFPNAQGYYSNFTNLDESYIVTSSYVFGVVVPPGSSSFEFNPSNSAMPTGSFYFRGTGGIGITVDTYSGSYVVSPSQGYNGKVLNTFPLTPVPNFQARVAANSGSYEALSCQNTVLADIGTEILSSASLLVTPNGYTEGVLFSTLPNSSSGDFTVTRATTATRVNAAGLVELVPYNLLTYSQAFDNAAWTKFNVTASTNSLIAPDGTLTAENISVSSTTNDLRQDVSVSQNTQYTFSFYAKKDTISDPQYRVINMTAVTDIIPRTSYGPILILNEWVRVTLTFTTPSGCSLVRVQLLANTNTSGSIGFWGAQLVEGTNALDYFATETRLNIPRLDYSLGSCPSILVEPQRTNLIQRSEEFDNASWAKQNSSVTANTATSPSGVLNADTILANGVLSFHGVQNNSTSFTINTSYSYSVFAKKGTNNFIQIVAPTIVGGMFANYDLNNGTVGTLGTITGANPTASIVNYGNGWYRCILNFIATDTQNSVSSILLITSATSIRAESNTLSTSVFLWGAQLEAGNYSTSYIPTTSASVTRNADVIEKTGISSLIGQTEGTLFIDIDILQTGKTNRIIAINDGTAFGNVNMLSFSPTNRFQYEAPPINILSGIYSAGRYKVAVVYSADGASIWVNGSEVATTSTATTSTGYTKLYVGSSSYGVGEYKGVNYAAIWQERLTDDQLEALTTL
jgi:hypothetical protein